MKIIEKLRLQTELRQKKDSLKKLREQKVDFERRSAELEKALEEAESEEDLKTVQDSIEVLEKEAEEANTDNKIEGLEAEVNNLENKLNEAEAQPAPAEDNKQRGDENKMNRLQVREALKTGRYYEEREVKEFYEQFKNLRAVGGEGLTIPLIIVNRIMDILGDYTTLYPLVDKIRVQGTARILIDTDTTAATWIEQNGAIPSGEVGTITSIDFDGFKVGKVTFVDNYILQDSIINIDDYVTKKIARAIALALDKAILKGEGAANKQPTGIITALEAEQKADVEKGPSVLINTVKQIGLIDTGEDSVGEIVAVMNRRTYYNVFFEYSVQVNSSGNVVGKLPNLTNPDLIGLKVVFNNNMDVDKVLFGDMSKYTLVERENITIDKSEHVKFAEDQMAFRGKGRFDGKPTKIGAFVLVTLVDSAQGE